ncbi:hypothetical protein [Tenacibaculum maritimum]|uniref:hypothetical protein n=3 Tax=Tenacibaculum maritimum TaxID=107401 RepID=UPI001330DA7E|nr:hypothetical protein [Tenacibaculum maritimum]
MKNILFFLLCYLLISCKSIYYNDSEVVTFIKSKKDTLVIKNKYDNINLLIMRNDNLTRPLLIVKDLKTGRIRTDTIKGKVWKGALLKSKYKFYIKDNKNNCLTIGEYELFIDKVRRIDLEIEKEIYNVELYLKNRREFKKYINRKNKELCIQ